MSSEEAQLKPGLGSSTATRTTAASLQLDPSQQACLTLLHGAINGGGLSVGAHHERAMSAGHASRGHKHTVEEQGVKPWGLVTLDTPTEKKAVELGATPRVVMPVRLACRMVCAPVLTVGSVWHMPMLTLCGC